MPLSCTSTYSHIYVGERGMAEDFSSSFGKYTEPIRPNIESIKVINVNNSICMVSRIKRQVKLVCPYTSNGYIQFKSVYLY